MIRQVTWVREKPLCSRESQHKLAAPAGVIIPGQKSILLMACPSTISINTPRAATGTRALASLISWAEVEHRRQHQLRLPAVGQLVRTCRVLTPAPSESFSRLTGSFTSWA